MMNKDASEYASNIADLSPVQYYFWATYIPGRNGGYKKDFMRHKRLSDARNSLNMSREHRSPDKKQETAYIYQWDQPNNCWVVLEKQGF